MGTGERVVGFGGGVGAVAANAGGSDVSSICESAEVRPFSLDAAVLVELLVVDAVSSSFVVEAAEVAERELSLLGLGLSWCVIILTSGTTSFLMALAFLTTGAVSSAGLSLECKVRPIPGDNGSLPASLSPGLTALVSPADISTHLLPLLFESCVLRGIKDSLLAFARSIAKGFNGRSRGLRFVAAGLLARLSFSTLIFKFS